MRLSSVHSLADQAAQRAQTFHLRFFAAQLVVACLIPLVFAYPFAHPSVKAVQALLGAALFFTGALVTARVSARSAERDWYRSRAVAESSKSMAWKFAMKAQPYQATDGATALRTDLQSQLVDTKILQTTDTPLDSYVTPEMEAVRSKSWEERKTIYLEERVADQWRWYSEKCRSWSEFENTTFWVVLAIQVVSGLALLLRAMQPDWPFGWASVASAAGSSFVAWAGMRRSGETAQAYQQAAADLVAIRERSEGLEDEAAFVAWVNDAENAISREHTSWLARREVR